MKSFLLEKSVKNFLIKNQVPPLEIKVIQARLSKATDKRGLFPTSQLGEILGQELANAYRQACLKDPTIVFAGEDGCETTNSLFGEEAISAFELRTRHTLVF